MARQVDTSDNPAACPWCGAENQAAGSFCRVCRRVITRLPRWAQAGRRRRWRFTWRRLLLWGTATILLGLIAWLNYPFLPDPVILLFRRPTTSLASTSAPGQWAMSGGELQQRSYVASPAAQPAGRVAWSADLGEFTRSAPAVVDGVVYIGGHFRVVALEAATGRLLWDKPTTGPVQSSLAVAGENLYLGLLDHRVLALDRQTGEVRWEFQTGDIITASPVVAGGMAYLGSWDGAIYALDAATGRRIWGRQTQGPVRYSAAIHGGVLFAGSNDGSLYILNARTGQSRLRFRTPAPIAGPPVVGDGLVYFISGGVTYAVDAGARDLPGQHYLNLVWAQLWVWQVPGVPRPRGQPGGRWRFSPLKPDQGIISAPAATPEAFYVGDLEGNLYARDLQRGTELWRAQARGGVVASPLAAGDRIYVGDRAGFLYALDRQRGEVIWQLSLGSPIEVAPAFAAGRLYLRTTDGRLHAVE